MVRAHRIHESSPWLRTMGEAHAWLRKRVPKRVGVDRTGRYEFERRGVLARVGIYKAKRVLGF
jgi:hypothetical protein